MLRPLEAILSMCRYSLSFIALALHKGMSEQIFCALSYCLGTRGTTNCQWHDKRTQAQCNLHAHIAWIEQMPALIDAYLHWKYGPKSHNLDHSAGHSFSVRSVGITGMTLSVSL
jgi:hypothetical protein